MNDELDRLIDSALASYTPSEPRPGLERRIQAAVAADRPRSWGWRPLWAFAATAVLIAVVAIPLAHKSTQPAVAVLHTPQLAVVGDSAAAAPVPARYRQHPSVSHLSVATGSAVPTAPAKSSTGGMTPLSIEALDTKPITIAPIQIAALN
jgi:hypothetical protein